MTEAPYAPVTLDDMRAARERLAPHVVHTPLARWTGARPVAYLGDGAELVCKLELLQCTGTFKARGAVNTLLRAGRPAKVTAVSAGNHAIAAAYAAHITGADAKVVMLATANPARVAAARAWGAEVLIEPDGKAAFARVNALARDEGRHFIHPFEGPQVTEATAGVGLELLEDAGHLDAVVVATGGGGLLGGVATAVKALAPGTAVYGVQPTGADVVIRSLRAGAPQTIDRVDTIADSLAPPMTTPYAFETIRRTVDDVVTVPDDEMAAAACVMFEDLKLAVEPAAAAAAAAAFRPLRDRLRGKRVALVVCGANIDAAGFAALLERGTAALGRGVLAA